MTDFIVADAQRCIGCRTCEIACALAHSPSGNVAPGSFSPRLVVNKLSRISMPVMCRQCENAPCAASCPTSALTVAEHAVLADSSLCIGCKNCMVACPFGCITIDGPQSPGPREIIKCDLCASRDAGPACVEVCPTQALSKMQAKNLEELRNKRIEETARGSFLCRTE